MAIAFVGVESATPVSPDVTVNVPAGTSDGHVMLAYYTNGDDATSSVTMSGWTQIDLQTEAASSARTVALFYRVASSEPASYLMDNTGSTSNATGGHILTFSGVDSSVFDVTYSAGSHFVLEVNSSTPTPQPITTATDGAWVVIFAHCKETATTSITEPSGYTERVENLDASNKVEICSKLVSTFGTETPGVITFTATPPTADTAMFTIALKPASSGSTASVVLRRQRSF